MKIGFVSMPFVCHLNPMTTLARRLQSRGHEVAFIGVPDVEPFARAAGLDFVPFCENEYPAGSIAKLLRPVSKLHGLEAARWSVRERNVDLFNAASKHLPQKLAETGIAALVIDVIHTFLELVPMGLGMPYVQVSTGLHIDFSGATPPFFFSWPHETTPEALTRISKELSRRAKFLRRWYELQCLTPRNWVYRSIGAISARLPPSWP
ncbi:MAG TPA: hypothetical protein VGJ66_21340 [Pyrinomonadaceae bacterium]|jgi:zeaxanthin glucosyltransferase